MTPLQKIRTSFSTQLSLWVAGFVLVISAVVIILLTRFSEDVIRDETIDTTLQALENTALRIDNTLRQQEITARLENQRLRVNRSRIERLIEESGSLEQLRQSLPNAQLFVTRRDSSQLDLFITGGERSYRQLMYDENEVYIFSQPLGERQFCIAAVCPADDIYSRYSRMHQVLLVWGIGGILVLLVVLYIIIARHLRPLHQLADAAQSIAGGNLDTPIPDSHHEHETGRLQSNLRKMQRSLRAYMEEMQQKQTTLSRQNAELQAAYGEAQAYETMKATFLTEMTTKMAAPVEQVCHSTEDICRDYATLSKADMTALQTDIMDGTNTIVELLDQLILEPAET
ncbi:MAG: HAMP domain-containing protein [Prevotella sp.]|nr:HAMP domain-containing protein [Prevotella sp.]